MSAHPSQPRAGTALIVVGFVLAILFPIIGLILGIVVLTKGSKGPGWGIIAVSVVMMLLSLALFL